MQLKLLNNLNTKHFHYCCVVLFLIGVICATHYTTTVNSYIYKTALIFLGKITFHYTDGLSITTYGSMALINSKNLLCSPY